jgi:hypothetical protein
VAAKVPNVADRRPGLRRESMAEFRTPSGATVFVRRLRQLPRGQYSSGPLLRLELVAANVCSAEVRPQPDHVFRTRVLSFAGLALIPEITCVTLISLVSWRGFCRWAGLV